MIFGDPFEFAVEASLETVPRFGCVQGTAIAGRLRVWLEGVAIGRVEEPSCWLGPPCEDLFERCERLDDLWDPSLAGLDPDGLFDRLDYLYYGAHRGRSLSDSWSESEWSEWEVVSGGFNRFSFLTNTSEAFDGWKAFLLRPSESTLLALVSYAPGLTVQVFRFSPSSYVAAVDEFRAWLQEQERSLLAGPGSGDE